MTSPVSIGTLGRDSVRSTLWLVVSQGLFGLAMIALPARLGRVAGAAELGFAEAVVAAFFLIGAVLELGTGPAVVQRKDGSPAFLSTVLAVNLATGAIGSLLLLAGPPLADAVFSIGPKLVGLLQALSPVCLVLGAAVVPANLLARRMAFGTVAGIGVMAGIAGTVTAAVLVTRWGASGVVAGLNVYALANGAGVAVAARWRPSAWPDRTMIGPLFRFSLPLAGSRVLSNLNTAIERLLIGGMLGATELGLFAAARSVARTPFLTLLPIPARVMFPALAQVQGNLDLTRRYYLHAVVSQFVIFVPFVVFAAVFAADLVFVLYGPGWSEAVVVTQLLALVTVRTLTNFTVGAVFLSQGRTDLQLRWAIVSNVLAVLCVVAGQPWNVAGVAAAFVGLGLAGWIISHAMANPLVGVSFKDLLSSLARPAAAGALFAAVLVGVREAIGLLNVGAGARLAVAAMPAAAAYAVAMRLVAPGPALALRRLVSRSFTGARST